MTLPHRYLSPARLFTVGMLVALLATLLTPATASAATDKTAETRFVDSINAERAQRGLPRLIIADDLVAVARRHSKRMADKADLHHNENLGKELKDTWKRLTENVGRGGSVPSLHQAFMNSSGHRANILDSRVTEIGVGVEVRGGTVWVTHVFRLPRTAAAVGFSDVPRGHTHRRGIYGIAAAGITMGCGGSRYCPDRRVTRAEMATFLARSSALLPTTKYGFTDTNLTPVHSANIGAIAQESITTGCAPDRYCPTRYVTRAEMASFLARATGLRGSSKARFSDVPRSSTHFEAINAIAEAGLTVGCGNGRYCPDRRVTRAEMATFLSRAWDF